MYSLNILVVVGYILVSILLVSLLKQERKWIALLLSSLTFYFFFVDIQILILLSIWLIAYGFGRHVKAQKLTLRIAVPLTLSPLLLYKLTSSTGHFETFASRSVEDSYIEWGSFFHVIGVSYFTFLAISYLNDVRRGYIQPEKNPFRLLLYLLYFPTIFSGPLHRYKYMSEQFKGIAIDSASISNGLRLILWGLFKSLVVASRILNVMQFFMITGTSGPYYFIIGFLFFLYLYISFSSFVDISLGISEIFKISLKDNFKNRIYTSHSRQHFWSGWHITLNEWFRDYFFFPLAKKRRNTAYIDLILLLTFLLIALWHEVSKAMIIWGSLNGLWIVLEKKVPFQKWPYAKMRRILGVAYHLIFSSFLALVFITPNFNDLVVKVSQKAYLPLEKLNAFTFFAMLFAFLLMDWIYRKAENNRIDQFLLSKPITFRWFVYLSMVISILLLGHSGKIDNYYIQF